MATTLVERKREVAKKALVSSTKSFHEKQASWVDGNGKPLCRFKNALSDMDHTQTMNWLETTLWYQPNLQLLNKFLSTCYENGVTGTTACMWTKGILESDAYGIDDAKLVQIILDERDQKKLLKLPDLFERSKVTAEEAHLIKVRSRKEKLVLLSTPSASPGSVARSG
jgi:hypothetical protein